MGINKVLGVKEEKTPHIQYLKGRIATILGISLLILPISGCSDPVYADSASYYTITSCLKEGTSGIMACGERLNDDSYICASWDYPFGTRLLVTNLANGKKVVVVVKDRGPAKRLYKQGRKIDLSYKAMCELDGIRKGIIQVQIEKVR